MFLESLRCTGHWEYDVHPQIAYILVEDTGIPQINIKLQPHSAAQGIWDLRPSQEEP